MGENKLLDLVIIGCGPAGVSAAIYAKRANLDFAIIEKMNVGGKLIKVDNIENYPGYKSIKGFELSSNFASQLSNLNIKTTFDEVINIEKNGLFFNVVCRNNLISTKSIIIATGLTSKKLMIPGEDKFFGRGVSYCATCDGFFFKDKEVAVCGDFDEVYKEVNYLAGVCKKVYFVTKNKEISFDFENVEVIYDAEISEIIGDNVVSKISVKSGDDIKNINVSGVFPYGKQTTNLQYLKNLGLDLENGFIKVNIDMSSNIKGIFSAGDVANNPLKQIVTACSDGAIAATSVIKYVKGLKNE